ncbi:hypothetical protein [Nonomuraea sp. SBT364]|uniref:hypothetical protein n=1 Tax=Nonomuraea sp. SBT364 TaxID=1580530 RepID=UPI000A75BD56|nr:hypothetical protein [Nonomuraea sp. SBT364]
MRSTVRSLIATATGAAILFGGPAATAQDTKQPDFTGAAWAGAYVPLQGETGVTATLKLRDPETVKRVTGGITAPGKAERPVTFDLKPGATVVTGRWAIGTNDPPGDWKLNVTVTRDAPRDNAFTVRVAGKQRITDANVTPDPVRLVKGKDVEVKVEAAVKGSGTVTAKLRSDGTRKFYDLGVMALEPDGYHRGSTYFSDDTAPGAWTLEVYATRGGEALKGVVPFTVEAPAAGVSKKATARVTIGTAKKVKRGKSFRVYGKAYRGAKPYKGKKLRIYFKVKGTKTYKLVAYATTNSSGKYTRTFRARKDGYYRVRSLGTAGTRAALSPQRLVDVR